MTNHQSRWQDPEVAQAFVEGVRGAIPGAALQLEVLSTIIGQWRPAATTILDLGCGDGALGRLLLDEFPEATVIFADFSPPMLAKLAERLGPHPRATVVSSDFATPAWRQALAATSPIDVVVSGFAIHHQADDRKQALYAEIYDLLAPGGLFLNLEHVSSATLAGSALFDSFFIEYLCRFHGRVNPERRRDEIATTYYNRPDKAENILAPVDRQCHWLREIGFQDVDCFLKVFELALFGGRKPADHELATAR